MDEKMMVQWSQTAQELARVWFPSMRSRSRVRLVEEDIRDFLIDLWLEKGGQGPEFDEANRGQLYNYVLLHVGNSRDVLASASLMSEMCCASGSGHGENDEIDEDRFDFLAHSDDDDQADEVDELATIRAVQDAGDSDDLDALDQRLEELAALRDSGLSGAFAEIFGVSDRRGRMIAAEIRSEKALDLIVDAARRRGMKPAEVKKLAAEISAERRKSIARINAAGGGGDISYSEIEAFEEMMGLEKAKPTTPAPTATTAKNRLLLAKRQRKSAQTMPKVPKQQIPTQLELV